MTKEVMVVERAPWGPRCVGDGGRGRGPCLQGRGGRRVGGAPSAELAQPLLFMKERKKHRTCTTKAQESSSWVPLGQQGNGILFKRAAR